MWSGMYMHYKYLFLCLAAVYYR